MRTIYLDGVAMTEYNQSKPKVECGRIRQLEAEELEESGEYAVVEYSDESYESDCDSSGEFDPHGDNPIIIMEEYVLVSHVGLEELAKATMSAYSHEASLSLDDSYEGEE